MSKKNIDIFNISIYQNLLRNYKYILRNLDKYLTIYQKMDKYYSKEEIKYIFEILVSQLDDLIGGKVYKKFVPIKIQNEIHKYKVPIKKMMADENYQQIIKNYTKIFLMINIEKQLND